MSRLDIVIFGATGFTGRKAVEEIVRVSKKYPGLTWAIAGRSQSKLEDLRSEVSKITGEDLSLVKIIVADVKDEKSLKDMCDQAKVIANCCGPYRHYGEEVVRAAVQSHTHYVDVSGEPQFIESMQLKYDQQAREAGVYVISACGFDSVPNDMGVVFLQQNFNGTVNSVESFLSASIAPPYAKEAYRTGAIHYGTWESLVYSLSQWGELAPLRKKLYPEPLPAFKPRLQARRLFYKKDDLPCLPFPGADNSIVYRTQRYLYESQKKRPAQFKAYLKFDSWCSAAATFLAGLVLALMTKTNWGTQLLLNYPRLFSLGLVSRDGPSEDVTRNTNFTAEIIGQGWDVGADVDAVEPNKTVTVKVSGSNPGYGATVTALVFCALTVLKEQDKMPDKGGVLTTGAAFRDTQLVSHLNQNNLTFQVVDTTSSL